MAGDETTPEHSPLRISMGRTQTLSQAELQDVLDTMVSPRAPDPSVKSTGILRHLSVFETAQEVLLVGSNSSKTAFSVLRFARDSVELNVEENSGLSGKALRVLLKEQAQDGIRKVLGAETLLGVVKLYERYYLILVTEHEKLGVVAGKYVYSVKSTQLLSIGEPGKKPSQEELKYKTCFTAVDLTEDFYYSYEYDLSNTVQSNMLPRSDSISFNEKFLWNYYPGSELIRLSEHSEGRWLVPLIHGSFGQQLFTCSSRKVLMTLIARRSRHFAGTRYNKRGISEAGDVANEVETELILEVVCPWVKGRGPMSSFVMIRGSIPLFWKQTNPLAPKPDILISKTEPDLESTRKHFSKLLQCYNAPIVCVNLVKLGKSTETVIGSAFEAALGQLAHDFDLVYVDYDFLNNLKAKLPVTEDLNEMFTRNIRDMGWFHLDSVPGKFHTAQPSRQQSGIVRVNCVDCLDRTNVAQFCLGMTVLGPMLKQLGVISETKYWESQAVTIVETLHRLFVAHGDRIAKQYGGSGTMHKATMPVGGTDSTKSKASGKLGNAFTAVKRYYSNNFIDADKQAAMNVFLGTFIPHRRQVHIWEMEKETLDSDIDALHPREHHRLHGPALDTVDEFHAYFQDLYQPEQLTSFDEAMKSDFTLPIEAELLSIAKTRASSLMRMTGKLMGMELGDDDRDDEHVVVEADNVALGLDEECERPKEATPAKKPLSSAEAYYTRYIQASMSSSEVLTDDLASLKKCTSDMIRHMESLSKSTV